MGCSTLEKKNKKKVEKKVFFGTQSALKSVTLCRICKVNANKPRKETVVLKNESGSTSEREQAVPEAVVAKNEPIGDALSIRGQLHLLGWKSFNVWAQAHGYKSRLVIHAVNAWGQRTDRAPHGDISRAVMRDLRQTIAQGLRPDDVQAVQQAA